MGFWDDGYPILHIAAETMSLSESTIEEGQRPQMEYKDHNWIYLNRCAIHIAHFNIHFKSWKIESTMQ